MGSHAPWLNHIKERIEYGYDTRKEVIFKVGLAIQLGIVPFIIARYVDKDTIYREVINKGGICYPYRTLLVSPTYNSLASELRSCLDWKGLSPRA